MVLYSATWDQRVDKITSQGDQEKYCSNTSPKLCIHTVYVN